ncbi:hypothetical protein Q7C36_010855 [Tachysurus vachellii]|uniref:Uncharacterized protein n=1 Tax=Tachysurus vachellii TaxID=175792 RepID=A0AA88SP65_TACVA|nr:spermatogenesis-associated protein 45-like [Tachysurus vachellii]KAK2846001.1 hypothetical protein Q7C36_010855 [Tachysurus vachellii]
MSRVSGYRCQGNRKYSRYPVTVLDLHVDFKMKQEQLHELNMRRETWCCVEADNRIWNRPERKHFARHLRNTCDFNDMLTVKPEVRSTWMTWRSTNHREKRHFDESYNSHFT